MGEWLGVLGSAAEGPPIWEWRLGSMEDAACQIAVRDGSAKEPRRTAAITALDR